MTRFFLKVTTLLLLLVRAGVCALMLLFIVAIVAQFNSNVAKNEHVILLLHAETRVSQPVDPFLKSIAPVIRGFDTTNLVKLLVCMFLLTQVKNLSWRLVSYRRYLDQKKKLESWRLEKNFAGDNSIYMALEKKIEQISKAEDPLVLQRLNLEFVQLKKKLEGNSRFLAFLSIDVVDSTGMKDQEDKSMIQLDFIRYKHLIQIVLDKYGCVKSAWTPDGVMVCFKSVDSAVCAAQESLVTLQRFNNQHKQINRDFMIRCGIHAGQVYYDDSLPMEEMTDKVIDIAGHMQKYAEPGTIALSRVSLELVGNQKGFTDVDLVVDDMAVSIWGLKKSRSAK